MKYALLSRNMLYVKSTVYHRVTLILTFRWEFLTEDYDIGFGIYKKTAECQKKSSEMVEILKNQRANSHMVPEDGVIECQEIGTCKYKYSSRHYENTPIFKDIENFTTKHEHFQIKNSDIFHISAQNIDCGYSLESPRRGGSNEYPQSMFLSRNKKNNVYPCKPQFYCIKVGFKGV